MKNEIEEEIIKLTKLLALDYQNKGNEESFELMNYLLANLGKRSFKKNEVEVEYDIAFEKIITYVNRKIIESEDKYKAQLDKWINFKKLLEEFKNTERKVEHISVTVT